MQRLDQADRPEPPLSAEKIDRPQAASGQDRVDHAVMSQNLLEAERPDERRQDHRNHDEQVRQVLARKLVTVVKQRQRKRDQEDEKRRHPGDGEAVDQPFAVDEVAEHLRQQPPVQPDFDHRVDRSQQEDAEKQDHRRQQPILDETVAHAGHLPAFASRSASR
ncbi:hypothetical protein SDC9_116053 [bioreactor metagenome]|uniref:Uncharacterized protein n=1 Tax=bioreactor metagenome TaxID=1076179 RepID=A0A645BUJ4_9ZZZZ